MSVAASTKRRLGGAAITLGLILAVAAALRFHDVTYRTLNHPEVYSPGIDLPWGLSNPNPRFSLFQTLAGSISGEPHPPGYYILMLGWTKLAGSSLLALRLPSVLFGIGSVLLVYGIARKLESGSAALLAAAMLALNGLHLELSQIARMYSMACFLGLASTLLLVDLTSEKRRLRLRAALYVVVTVAGLGTHVYVWPLFLTQILWVIVADRAERGSLTGLLRLQLFTWILATPLIAIALYQMGHTTRPPTLGPVAGLFSFLQAGALFEMAKLDFARPRANEAAAALAIIMTMVLLAAYVRMRHEQGDTRSVMAHRVPAPPRLATTGLAVLMASLIVLFAYVATRILPGRSVSLVVASCVLPLALAAVDFWVAGRADRREDHPASAGPGRLGALLRSLPVMLAVVPVSCVAGFSLVNPIFTERGAMVYAPYLLIVLAAGLAYLLRRNRSWVTLVLLLAGVHGLSLAYFKSKPVRRDFKTLAARWVSRIEPSDLIFVHGRGHQFDWEVAPIYYYMNAARYHYVGRDFGEAVQRSPRSRVWVLSIGSIPTEAEALDALAGRRIEEQIRASGLTAALHVPDKGGR